MTASYRSAVVNNDRSNSNGNTIDNLRRGRRRYGSTSTPASPGLRLSMSSSRSSSNNAVSLFLLLSLMVLVLLLDARDYTYEPSSSSSNIISFGCVVQAFSTANVNTASTSSRPSSSIVRRSRNQINSFLHSSQNGDNNSDNGQTKKIRLNKVFKKTHSRREADKLIEAGRVSVNGEAVSTKGGFFVVPYVDEIELDGNLVEGWEEMNFVNVGGGNNNGPKKNVAEKANRRDPRNDNDSDSIMDSSSSNNNNNQKNTFEYIKYWKPRGVICTTDPDIPNNIIDEIRVDGYDPPHRVYPVGRLDKDTSGMILLTSDGRLPNAALRRQHKRSKIYELRVDRPISPQEAYDVLHELRNGVVISTETVRNGIRTTLTAPTKPCEVEQINDVWLRITLQEGRNRQVRKMTRAVGYRTLELERVSFAGIPLEPGLRGPGDWDYLSQNEIEIVEDIIRVAAEAAEDEAEKDEAEETSYDDYEEEEEVPSSPSSHKNEDEDGLSSDYTANDVGW